MAAPSGPRASFFRRLGASLLDGIILGVADRILGVIAGSTVGAIVAVALGIGYYGYLEGSASGQTLGKRALGIRVIDLRGSGPIGLSRGVLRYFARFLSALAFFLGYLWMLWDPEKQTWHDKIAGTVVVPVGAFPVASWPGGSAAATQDGDESPPSSSPTDPRTETLEEEQLRKFNDREKQWGSS